MKYLTSFFVIFAILFGSGFSVLASEPMNNTIQAAYASTLFIKNDGSLWGITTGPNCSSILYGKSVGLGSSVPLKIMDNVVSVSAGTWHALALKEDGSVWAWGDNYMGKVGNGQSQDEEYLPSKIMDNAVAISACQVASYALKTDGSLWGWGSLGGDLHHTPIPTKLMDDVVSMSIEDSTRAVIKTDGSLWVWGNNYNGRLGIGKTENTQVTTPTKVLDGVSSVSVGFGTIMAIKTDGGLWGWGYNSEGELGDGTFKQRTEPAKIMDDVSFISLGHSHTLAVKTDGSLWAWGGNVRGQIGNGKYGYYEKGHGRHQLTPVKVMDDVVIASASASLGTGQLNPALEFSLALKKDGSLWGWGGNSYGVLGDGTDEDRPIPIKITDGVKVPSRTPAQLRNSQSLSNIRVLLNGKELKFDLPIISRNNSTYYPMRQLFNALGADVSWNPDTRTASGSLGENTVEFTVDKGEYTVNGEVKTMETPVFIQNGSTYIPIRYAAEGLGFTVEWNGDTNTISISK